MSDRLMALFAFLFVLAACAVALHGVRRRAYALRRSLAVAVLLLPAALLYGLAHVYWAACVVLVLAAAFPGLAVGERLAARRQRKPRRPHGPAPRK